MVEMIARLGDILIADGVLTEESVNYAIQSKSRGMMLGDWLLQQGTITRAQLGKALQRQFDVQYAEIDVSTQNPQIVRLIPEPFARSRMVVAFAIKGRTLALSMVAPDDIETIAEVELMTGYHVDPFIGQESNIRQAIDRGYDDRSTARQTIVDLKIDELDRLGIVDSLEETQDVNAEEDAPVVRLVQAILTGAIDAGASDIHLEPNQPEMRVRYRVDGELQQVMTIPSHIEHSVVSRIKVMADMNTTENRRAQDGHLSLSENGKKVNYRVSSIPTVNGEKMVLRLIDEGSKIYDIRKLGIEECDLQLLQTVIEKPHGMFIVTGPTGSGKSTTLYALLSKMNEVSRNIVTVEDPVEYRLPGINQVQSNNEHGLGFTSALKYIMRQDPDVIMIGEIRDHETAGLAVQAALTGHLMISTLHTNDAPSAVIRLGDLGIDHFKIASSLIGSIAQRLLRRICPECKIEVPAKRELLERLGMAVDALQGRPLYHGRGCSKCLGTGYSGRLPIFEIMLINDALVHAIERGAPVSELRDIAKQHGMRDLQEAGMSQALAGNTTLEEVYFKSIG
jgi:type IV pilus assembly protein PilB